MKTNRKSNLQHCFVNENRSSASTGSRNAVSEPIYEVRGGMIAMNLAVIDLGVVFLCQRQFPSSDRFVTKSATCLLCSVITR